MLPISPRALGTKEVESLGSYVIRCANHYELTNDQLLKYLILEARHIFEDKPALIEKAQSKENRIVGYKTSLSVPNELSTSIVAALNEVFQTQVFSTLGLYKLYPQFSHYTNLVDVIFRWCPRCWAEEKEKGREPYFKFIWSFSGLATCPNHRTPLTRKCGSCGAPYWFGSKMISLDTCTSCGSNLAEPGPFSSEETSRLRWPIELINLIEEIQRDPHFSFPYRDPPDMFSWALKSRWVPSSRLREIWVLYSKFTAKPTLRNLRNICRCSGVELWEMLAGDSYQLPLLLPIFGPPMDCAIDSIERKKNKSKRRMLRRLKELMHANSSSPRPAKFYADQVGISADGLAYRFPGLYRRIVEYHNFHLTSERVKLRMEIDMVLELMREGRELDRGVKKICYDLMEKWGFPKNLSRGEIKRFRDEIPMQWAPSACQDFQTTKVSGKSHNASI